MLILIEDQYHLELQTLEINQHFSKTYHLRIQEKSLDAEETPALKKVRLKTEKQQQATAQITQDRMAQALLQAFDATVEQIDVQGN